MLANLVVLTLQHVTLEVSPDAIERSVEFWGLLGFGRVEPPAALAGTFVWMERAGTQIHLERNPSPVVPPHGHAAVVVEHFEPTVERLRQAGFEVSRARALGSAARQGGRARRARGRADGRGARAALSGSVQVGSPTAAVQ